MGSQSDTYEMLTAAKCGHELNVMIGRASDLDNFKDLKAWRDQAWGFFLDGLLWCWSLRP